MLKNQTGALFGKSKELIVCYGEVHHSQTVAPGGAGGTDFDGLDLGLLLESSSLMKNLGAPRSFDRSMTGLVGKDIPIGGDIGLASG